MTREQAETLALLLGWKQTDYDTQKPRWYRPCTPDEYEHVIARHPTVFNNYRGSGPENPHLFEDNAHAAVELDTNQRSLPQGVTTE
jgi:hypothetical protein